ncbi:MAG: c-type cytochrome [Alphaproteobacteria bacterium]|nr:c-type cytochrome [Alphaproteobacteria bacterium]
MRPRRVLYLLVFLLVAAIGGFVWWSQFPLIDRIEVPDPASFERNLVDAGAKLAAIGNCRSCHTDRNGPEFAGGRAIATPYGKIYSTNISPAPGTGLGHWSEAAFARAMRQGIARNGAHLYPAFPYDHFTRLTDNDLRALYAFLMTRPPVENFVPANELPFPLNQRWGLAFWNALFLDRRPVMPDPSQSPEWNRGAYLVAGLGHCGDCHTPRNLLGAEERSRALSGGEAEGWPAPSLGPDSPAPVPWNAEHLFAYLRHGSDTEHGAPAGPMQSVTDAMSHADEVDVRAIATYVANLQPATTTNDKAPQRQATAASQSAAPGPGEELGATIVAGACAGCHAPGQPMVAPHGLNLALSSALHQSDPRDAILIVLGGLHPSAEHSGPMMPAFSGTLTDAQVAAALQYLRRHSGQGPAWADLEDRVRDVHHAMTGSGS